MTFGVTFLTTSRILSATAAEETLAGKHHDVLGRLDLNGLGREDFVNLLAQTEHVDIDGDFEVLALIGFVPDEQGNAARSFAVDQNLIGAHDDGFGDGRIRERNALDPRGRSDDQRATHEQVQRLRNFGRSATESLAAEQSARELLALPGLRHSPAEQWPSGPLRRAQRSATNNRSEQVRPHESDFYFHDQRTFETPVNSQGFGKFLISCLSPVITSIEYGGGATLGHSHCVFPDEGAGTGVTGAPPENKLDCSTGAGLVDLRIYGIAQGELNLAFGGRHGEFPGVLGGHQ